MRFIYSLRFLISTWGEDCMLPIKLHLDRAFLSK